MRTNKFHFPFFSCFRKSKSSGAPQASFLDIADVLSQELKAKGKDRTAKIYRMVAGCFTRFAG
ncbi:MAG: hypothetical protein LBC40_03620, partial [Dysgonamonadaceae bacterium]|nr:hypothetical protein [Dysgonamonadaceae bacterium]